jgi:hypothetical protein
MPVSAVLQGGLGNQLFTIAAGCALAKKKSTNFFITLNEFGGCGQGKHPANYYKTIYKNILKQNRTGPVITHKEKQWTYYNIEPCISDINCGASTVVLDGYFQSEKHFLGMRSELKELFAAPDFVLAFLTERGYKALYPELFEPHNYCFIGVRRGDYVARAAVHNPCGMTYFKAAMGAASSERYYIASDDMNWCRRQFIGPQYVFLDIKDDLELMYLGTLFPKYIISNSSYHWWMSYLSLCALPQVIAPDKWIFGAGAARSEYDSIYRDEMAVLERPVETD